MNGVCVEENLNDNTDRQQTKNLVGTEYHMSKVRRSLRLSMRRYPMDI